MWKKDAEAAAEKGRKDWEEAMYIPTDVQRLIFGHKLKAEQTDEAKARELWLAMDCDKPFPRKREGAALHREKAWRALCETWKEELQAVGWPVTHRQRAPGGH